jgi:hypothetical protein
MGLDCGRERGPSRADRAEDGLARLAFLQDADPAALSAAVPLARWLAVGPGELVLDFGDATDDVFSSRKARCASWCAPRSGRR